MYINYIPGYKKKKTYFLYDYLIYSSGLVNAIPAAKHLRVCVAPALLLPLLLLLLPSICLLQERRSPCQATVGASLLETILPCHQETRYLMMTLNW